MEALTVIQLNTYIKNLFHKDFILQEVRVRGEVSNLKKHGSGHIYFTLKDQQAAISCVLFRNYVDPTAGEIKDGQSIEVAGSVSVYEKTGQYQIYVRKVIFSGIGDLLLEYRRLLEKLKQKGLFERQRKKPIPKYSQTIGIITSDTGAAIHDIVSVAKRRNPYVRLLLYPSLVQGQTAKYSLVEAIRYFNQNKVDVILLGRGGGSIEDLWPFNEEIVVEAIAASEVPIVTGIGHESDTTLSDYAADVREATPSAAAERIVFEYQLAIEQLADYRRLLSRSVYAELENNKYKLNNRYQQLVRIHPRKKLEEQLLHLDMIRQKLIGVKKLGLAREKSELMILREQLVAQSPYKSLAQGYGYITKQQVHVKSVKQLVPNDVISIRLEDGLIKAMVSQVEETN